MDSIIKEIENKIFQFNFEDKMTDKACFNKIKMDYLLVLTLAACWDIKSNQLTEDEKKAFLSAFQRPQTGDLIRIIDSLLKLDKSIVNILDIYKEGRNSLFGHTTFDEYEAKRLNRECEQCWNAILKLEPINDTDSNLIREIYQEQTDFYYIANIKSNNNMLVKQFGNKTEFREFSQVELKSRLLNKSNTINKGDLFLLVNSTYIKLSPFIQYNDIEELFMLIMDIELDPLQFKMAYIFRTSYAQDSVTYLDEFPIDFKLYYPENSKKINKNGLTINKFSQFDLFKQEYYKDINKDLQNQLNNFVIGNMPYGAVRGVGGVGKTSLIFMWLNRLLNNEENILDNLRTKFNLKRIIFLSAKTKIYSRDINTDNDSSLYDITSDIEDYNSFIESVYSILHNKVKNNTQFIDKENFLKNYCTTSNGILLIIDDYESLPEESRDKIQLLKDSLDSTAIKLLITTRFFSKESKDIIVNTLCPQDCAKMADYIFGDNKWREDLSIYNFHKLTGGLPLLIWYAKAYYKMGWLTTQKLQEKFSGPQEGLDLYLYSNFENCFESSFTRNFLMIASRYYEVKHTLQISKKIAIFLCLENPQNFKKDDEEFYLKELIDLKLISINQSTNSIDFSPLMVYMDKSTNKPEAQEVWQEDSLKILNYLNEEAYKELYGVIDAATNLDTLTRCRILKRILHFSYESEDLCSLAINNLFEVTDEKLELYKKNEKIFLQNVSLIKSLLKYLVTITISVNNCDIITDFLKIISIKIPREEALNKYSYHLIEVAAQLLIFNLDQRERETLTNAELRAQTHTLINIVIEMLPLSAYNKNTIVKIKNTLDSISIYCDIPLFEI